LKKRGRSIIAEPTATVNNPVHARRKEEVAKNMKAATSFDDLTNPSGSNEPGGCRTATNVMLANNVRMMP
jgi:hypothetical protein